MRRRDFLLSAGVAPGLALLPRAVSRSAGTTEITDRPLEIGVGPQLFLDDYLIERAEGLERKVRQPERLPNPVLDSKRFGVTQPYLTALRDPDTRRFRMWYNRGPAIWHAESDDGIRWREPRAAWDLPRGYGASLVDDGGRGGDPRRRFKLANWQATRGREDGPGDDGGMWVGFSPDGLRWAAYDRNPVLPTWPEGYGKWARHGVGDTVDVSYDPPAGLYRAAVKVHALAEDGYAPGPKAGKAIRRLVGMSTSEDFLRWERPWRILTPDAKDDGLLEFYGMGGVHPRGGLRIGLARVLRDDLPCDPGGPRDGIGYTVLATSRDGVAWHRFREPFLDRSPERGGWDHAMAWMSAAVPVGDEVFFYYGGYARGHKIEPATERQIGLARMKRDRYAAMSPVRREGTLLTRPFVVPAERLTINAEATGGEVRVRVLGEDGTVGESTPVTCDGLAVEAGLQGPLRTLRGKPARLEVRVRRAALFGLEFHA